MDSCGGFCGGFWSRRQCMAPVDVGVGYNDYYHRAGAAAQL